MNFDDEIRKRRRQSLWSLTLTYVLASMAFGLPLLALGGDATAVLAGAIVFGLLYVPTTLLLASRLKLQLADCTYPWPDRRQDRFLVHVVEEMSLAAGLRSLPRVLVAKGPDINAFVVGLTRRRATICVSRGALENLRRDELQAVVLPRGEDRRTFAAPPSNREGLGVADREDTGDPDVSGRYERQTFASSGVQRVKSAGLEAVMMNRSPA